MMRARWPLAAAIVLVCGTYGAPGTSGTSGTQGAGFDEGKRIEKTVEVAGPRVELATR